MASRESFIKNTCSSVQEEHQLAKTFNRETRPFIASGVKSFSLPTSIGNLKSGKILPNCTEGNFCGSKDKPRQKKKTNSAKIAAGIRRKQKVFIISLHVEVLLVPDNNACQSTQANRR